MLEKEVFFAKFRTIILNIAEIHKILVKKLTSDVLIFKIVLKDWKIITVSNIERKYEPCREINKIKRFLKQVKLVNNITLNSIKLMKIFRVTMLSLKYVEKSRRTRNKLKIKGFITNRGFCRQIFKRLTFAGLDRDLSERALTLLEKPYAVANDNEAGTEETGLDTVEEDKEGKSQSCLI